MVWSVRHAARSICAACVFVGTGGGCGAELRDVPRDPPTIEFRDGLLGFESVDVHPISPSALRQARDRQLSDVAWQQVLGVHAGDVSGLPMAGIYSVAGDTLRFQPSFPPLPGPAYVARYDSRALYDFIDRSGPTYVTTRTWEFTRVKGPPSAVVRQVYPTADVVPMNLLKMYVEFSAPMSTGSSYDHIKLYDERDSLLVEPFFTAGGAVELWDPDKTRLTILFDPGRIKRDLKPNQQLGLPLRTGVRYRLVLDSNWPAAQGTRLLRSYEKRFRVGGLDRSLVRTATWRVTTPRVGSRDSLVIDFPEPLDRALLGRMLVVRDSTGQALVGNSTITRGETRWTFVPHMSWIVAPYYVEVDTELEDLAGNNLKRLFDVAPGDSTATASSGPRARIPFRPRSPGGAGG